MRPRTTFFRPMMQASLSIGLTRHGPSSQLKTCLILLFLTSAGQVMDAVSLLVAQGVKCMLLVYPLPVLVHFLSMAQRLSRMSLNFMDLRYIHHLSHSNTHPCLVHAHMSVCVSIFTSASLYYMHVSCRLLQ